MWEGPWPGGPHPQGVWPGNKTQACGWWRGQGANLGTAHCGPDAGIISFGSETQSGDTTRKVGLPVPVPHWEMLAWGTQTTEGMNTADKSSHAPGFLGGGYVRWEGLSIRISLRLQKHHVVTAVTKDMVRFPCFLFWKIVIRSYFLARVSLNHLIITERPLGRMTCSQWADVIIWPVREMWPHFVS